MNNETIEVIKRMVADGAISQESAEKYCPQLMWSEDEKVIRDIKVVLECSATKFFKEEGKLPIWYDRAIAWLEKQGEEKTNLNNWKPTKEQLKALSDVLQYNVVIPNYKTLSSLLKDLSDL